MYDEPREYYLILTHRLPFKPYDIEAGHRLRAIKASEQMLEGCSCSIHTQRMALPHLDRSSHALYKDLVIFHSFLDDEPETYQYGEYIERNNLIFCEPELDFMDDLVDFYIPPEKYGPFVFSKYGSTDFDRFPVLIFHDPRDITTSDDVNMASAKEKSAVAVPEVWSEWHNGMRFRRDRQIAYDVINYRLAFGLFRKLSSTDRLLANAIRLFVFSSSLSEVVQVYRNAYLRATLYVIILEAIAGVPKDCDCGATCTVSGLSITHRSESVGKWLADEYGHWFKNLRKMRQKFIHDIDPFDFLGSTYPIYDEWSQGKPVTQDDLSKEHSAFDDKEDIDKLGIIVRKTLIERFLHHYYKALDGT